MKEGYIKRATSTIPFGYELVDESSSFLKPIEEELEALKAYKENHPGESHDPTPLELYCDTHPDASECRVYDD
mgnify:CR=1 FL=1